MNARIQTLCAWSGPVFLVLYVLAFGALAGYLPPHPPSLGVDDVAAFYEQHRNAIRLGQVLGLILSTLLLPWFGVISAQMARIEKGFPILALIQFGGGVLLVVFFQICSMLWIIAAWRPELDPAIIRMLHEGSWLIFVMVFPAYTLQMICIATTIFMDRSEQPVFPRWSGYLHLWIGFSGMGGGLATFFKDGPFAWNGLIGFWIPVICFATWIVLMARWLLKGIARQATPETA